MKLPELFLSWKPFRNDRCWKRGEDGVTLLTTNSGKVIALAPLGAEIFHCCDGNTIISDILAQLKEKNPAIPGEFLDSEMYRFLYFMQSQGTMVLNKDNF